MRLTTTAGLSLALLLALTACGDATALGGENAPESDAAPSDDGKAIRELTEDAQPELGEPVQVGSSYTVALNEVTNGFECTSHTTHWDEPTSGEFMAAHLTAEAADDAVEPFEIHHRDFYVIDADGEMTDFGWHHGPERMCPSEQDKLVDEVRPGTHSTGVIVFDSAVESGTLVYEGDSGDIRWEF